MLAKNEIQKKTTKSSKSKQYIRIDGRKRLVHIGKKGGRYYLKNKKKHYIPKGTKLIGGMKGGCSACLVGGGGIDLSGALTAAGLFMFSEIATTGSQALVLLSDGAGKISKRVKDRIAQILSEKKINLYWIIIKEPNDPSLFSDNTYLEGREPTIIKLDKFFKSLNTEYQAYEAENPDALSSAIKDIDSKEKRPIEIEKDIPGDNYNPFLLRILLVLLFSLILIKNIKV